MEQYNKKIMTCLLLLVAGFFMFFNAVPSAMAQGARTVTVGTGSGSWGDEISLPVTVNNPANIGGIAFTLNFNPAVFEFAGITQTSKAISDGDEYKEGEIYVVGEADKEQVGNTLFYQYNDALTGKVLVAAASAKALTNGNIFNAKFKIKENAVSGTHTIGLTRSMIDNAAAGYNGPTSLPVLVGIPEASSPDVYPQYAATMTAGSINVSAPSAQYRTVSGTVIYEGAGAAVNGTQVTLQKQVGNSYINEAVTSVKGGSYSFADKLDGSYRILVSSLNPNFYSKSENVTVAGSNVTKNIVLPAPARVIGTVMMTGDVVLPGLRVKVTDSTGNIIMGTFSVNADGSFSSGPMPPGEYRTFALYGSLEQEFNLNDGPFTWDVDLFSITGDIDGLANGMVTVTASSATGKISRYVTVNVSQGSYAINNLVPAGDYRVSAVAFGQPVLYYNQKTDFTEADLVEISTADGIADFDFSADNKATISGFVAEGVDDLVGVLVFAFNLDTYGLQSTQTDENGEYSLTVTPGTYQLFAMDNEGIAYYYNPDGATTNLLNAAVIEVNKDDDLVKDIEIPARCDATLTGTVTFDGGTPAAALIVATSNNNMAMAITGRDGKYTLIGLCDGVQYTVEMDPVVGNYAIQARTVTGGTDTTLNFVIDTGNTLSGMVKDKDGGAPIAGAMIYLINQETQALVGGRMYFSDNDGEYEINDIPDGLYTIIAHHPEFSVTSINNKWLYTSEILHIELEKKASFKGTVLDGSNSNLPLSNVLVIVTRAGGLPFYDVTDRNGEWEINGLDSDFSNYIIVAQKQGYARQVLQNQTPAPGGAVVNFTLSKPSVFNLNGIVTSECADAPPVSGAIVMVSSASRNFFATKTTDANGAYGFTNLPQAADYRIVVLPGGELQPLMEENLGFSSDTFFNPVIPCGDSISGTVAFSGGGTAYVFLYTDSNVFVGYKTVSASGGAFQFNGLAGGSYKVFAVAGNASRWHDNQGTIVNATLVNAGAAGININLTN